MKRNSVKITVFSCLLALFFSTIRPYCTAEAMVRTDTTKTYKETKITTMIGLCGLYVNANGKLRISTQEWEQSVYRISGGKLKMVSDPMVKAAYNAFDYTTGKEQDTIFYANRVKKKGTSGCFTNGKKIFRYNKKGKITKVLSLLKKMKLSQGNFLIDRLEWVKKDLVAVGVWAITGEKPRVCLVDMKKGKIVKRYSTGYTALCGADGENIYVTSGSIADQTERFVKLRATTGKKLASIATKELRGLAAGRQDEYITGGYCRDDPMSTCYANGRLYIRYLTGVYTWNGRGQSFNRILDGDKDYLSGYWCGEFEVVGNRMYVLGNEDYTGKGVWVYQLKK